MNILKELRKEAKKSEEKRLNNDIKQEAEQFLLEAHKEDEKILHNIGLDHNIAYDKRLAVDYARTTRSEEIYQQQTFRGSEIKTLCNTYDLKMLHAQYYNGQIPSDLTRKLKEFEKNTGSNLVDSDNFFILAPVEQFKTIKHVPRSQDPILFYRTDTSYSRRGRAQEEDIFVQIHNWGDDFTFLRRFRDIFSTYDSSDGSNLAWFTGTTISYIIVLIFAGLGDSTYGILIFSLIYSIILFKLNHNLNYHDKWNTQNV